MEVNIAQPAVKKPKDTLIKYALCSGSHPAKWVLSQNHQKKKKQECWSMHPGTCQTNLYEDLHNYMKNYRKYC